MIRGGGNALHSHYQINILLISMLALCVCACKMMKKASFIGNKTSFCAGSHLSFFLSSRHKECRMCVCVWALGACVLFVHTRVCSKRRQCVLLQFNPIILWMDLMKVRVCQIYFPPCTLGNLCACIYSFVRFFVESELVLCVWKCMYVCVEVWVMLTHRTNIIWTERSRRTSIALYTDYGICKLPGSQEIAGLLIFGACHFSSFHSMTR